MFHYRETFSGSPHLPTPTHVLYGITGKFNTQIFLQKGKGGPTIDTNPISDRCLTTGFVTKRTTLCVCVSEQECVCKCVCVCERVSEIWKEKDARMY